MLLKNNTGGYSRVGFTVVQDPKDPTAFVYSSPGDNNIIGVVSKSVPKYSLCEIINSGTAKVFVFERTVKSSIIRAAKRGENISRGTCKTASNADRPYFQIGTALESGKGLINVALNLSSGEAATNYVPYSGATEDVDLGDYGMTANDATIGGTDNNFSIDSDGTVTLSGDARIYEGIWLDATGLKAPGVKPATYVDHGITGAWQFADSDTNNLVFNFRLREDMDRSVAPYIIIGWSTATTVTTETAIWQLEYLYTAEGDDTTAAAQDTLEIASNAIAQSHGLIVASFTGLDLAGADDLCLHCRLERLGADGDDDLTDTAELHGICLRYVANTLGEPL